MLTAIGTLPAVIRKTRAEARAADLENLQKAIEGWRSIADERQEEVTTQHERINLLNNKIDTLYGQIERLRNDLSSELLINNQLRIEAARDEVKMCQKRGCAERTPPTGF